MEQSENILSAIYDYMAGLLLSVFIVYTYESTECGSLFVIMLFVATQKYYTGVVSWKFCKLLV